MVAFSSTIAAQKITVRSPNQNQECHLNFGLADWKPLQYIDQEGRPQGFQVGFAKAIAAELNCSLNFTVGDWNEIIDGLKEGTIDFVPDATMTKERAEYANFSVPYRQDTFAIYVRADDKLKYQGNEISDLKKAKFRLAINRGFLYGKEIEAWQADQNFNRSIVYSDNTRQNFNKLLANQIDGFVEDPYVMAYLFRSKKETKVMTTLPIAIQSHQSCFMFSKKRISEAFIERFNQALNEVKKRQEFKVSWFNL